MYDTTTQAFDIKWPVSQGTGRYKYRPSLLTIWHKDPEKRRGRVCRRGDDTCGWSTPNPTVKEWEDVKKLAKDQYSTIFEKQKALKEGASYASIRNEPEIFDAIYWAWRAIKRYYHYKPNAVVWQYQPNISHKEFIAMFDLATCPVDNLKHTFESIKNEDDFESFFLAVYRNYLRFHRPWYKHPKWHFWHWSLQFHPWQAFRRRYFDKCCKCGKRGFPKGVSAMGDWEGTRIWHDYCGDDKVQTAASSLQLVKDQSSRDTSHE